MILGMSFREFLSSWHPISNFADVRPSVRNAYTLLDFGSWIDGGNDQQSTFIQMVPLTDVNVARRSFIQARLGGTDTISDSRWTLLPANQMQHSPISDEEKKKKYQEMILSRWPYIFAGSFVLLLLLIGCCIWRCCKRRRARKAKAAKTADKFGDVFSKDLPGQRSLSPPTSTTDLRAAPEPQLPSYAQSQESGQSYGTTHHLQSEYQQSNLGAQQGWQQDYTHGNYSQQSLTQSYPHDDQAGYPQHGAYPPQRY